MFAIGFSLTSFQKAFLNNKNLFCLKSFHANCSLQIIITTKASRETSFRPATLIIKNSLPCLFKIFQRNSVKMNPKAKTLNLILMNALRLMTDPFHKSTYELPSGAPSPHSPAFSLKSSAFLSEISAFLLRISEKTINHASKRRRGSGAQSGSGIQPDTDEASRRPSLDEKPQRTKAQTIM